MEALPGATRAVGGHPLAGKESTGPEAADASLFEQRTFVLTPSQRTSPEAVQRAKRLIEGVGGLPFVCSAAQHDEALAVTSHLPQIVSSSLATVGAGVDSRFVGPAFHDMTRIAASDSAIWRDVLLTNTDNVLTQLRRYISLLESVEEVLGRHDVAGIEDTMQRGRRAVATLVERSS
jgi:prephenate dehydrogenase